MISLADVTTRGRGLPSRAIVFGPSGVGKTSLAARMPGALVVQTEDGLDDLLDSGRTPEVAHTPLIRDWPTLIALLGSLDANEHGYKTIVVDNLTGAERLCHQHVCKTEYKGVWEAPKGTDSFLAYGKGPHVAATRHWPDLLAMLDLLRINRRMAILCLAHSTVRKRRRPDTDDFDQFVPALNEATLDLTTQWADAVLFMNFRSIVTKSDGRSKGAGGHRRALYCENRDTHLAKNRIGLAPQIALGESPDDAASAFIGAFREAKSTIRSATSETKEKK